MNAFVRDALLGIVQGLTEFLPVSSSGHLAAFARFLGDPEGSLALIVFLHLGTLLATAIVFRAEIGVLFERLIGGLRAPSTLRESDEGRELLAILLATSITAAFALVFKSQAEALTSNFIGLGLAFLFTAGLLLTTRRSGGAIELPDLRIAALIGLAQGVAILPGISRSGTTIAVAMLLGMRPEAAFRFSFLLSLPIILLAVAYETIFGDVQAEGFFLGAFVGGLTAFLSGLVALLWLRRLIQRGRFWLFSLYLLPFGITVLLIGLFGHAAPLEPMDPKELGAFEGE